MLFILTFSHLHIIPNINSSIEGRVIDEETQVGIKGVIVKVKFLSNMTRDKTITDENGDFRFLETFPGKIKFGFIPPKGSIYAVPNEGKIWKDEYFLNVGERIFVLKKLEHCGSLKFRLFDSGSGNPIFRNIYDIYLKERLFRFYKVNVDGNGESIVSQLLEGEYSLVAYIDRFWPKKISGIRVEKNKTTIIDVLFNSKLLPKVSGYVKDKNSGLPIEGIQISLNSEDNNDWACSITDQYGYYEFNGMKKGDYYLWYKGKNMNGEDVEYVKDLIILQSKVYNINLLENKLSSYEKHVEIKQ
ncbi:MAG: carboxypeptidase regulatory-like domain-containing protein [Candidatus Aminicenantes bacterium]|nr:carboxypeptidase regulatory-like domain-containing protein [Candidatus Aminicenantes bacterium]